MPKDSVIQRSFGAGELAPALHARADLVKYTTGLRSCKNFIVLKGGGVANRAGTRYIATCKTNSPTVLLMPYLSELAGESVLIEAGAGYFRFFVDGAAVNISAPPAWSAATNYVIGDLVAEGGVNYYARAASLNQQPPNATFWYALPGTLYEIPHPFTGSDLFYFSQSGRTITLTDLAAVVAPHELIFESLTRWIIRAVTTAPGQSPPTSVTLIPGGGAGVRRFAYQVTAARIDDYEESVASATVVAFGLNEPTEETPHSLTWTPPAGNAPAEYYVYGDPYDNGIFGFLGTAAQPSFKDVGFIPDFSITPPLARTPFAGANDKPRICGHYQQRRCLANTKNVPDGVFGSRIGFVSNFTISSPLQDDDAITFRMAGNHHHPVRHLVGLKAGLIVLTDAGEWTVRGGADGALTPSAIHAEQETYAGCHPVRPVVVGNSIIYVQARGSIVRDLQFNIDVDGLAGRDLTVFSDHLIKGQQIRDIDFAQDPDSIVWCIRADGVLLGLTYLREQDVWGWHRHDTRQTTTLGFFWDVCVVPETDVDAVYFIVRRAINGATVRYIERLEKREIGILTFDTDVFFVDAGLSYSGVPVNNVTGLGHLQGEVCAVVGDGAVIYDGDPAGALAANFTVTAGGTFPVVFPASYSNIHVGLPIRFAEVEALDLDVQGQSVRDKKKRVQGLTLIVDKSARTFRAGTSSTAVLRKVTVAGYESPGADLFSGNVELNIDSHFTEEGRVFIRHTDPLPLTILGIIPSMELGG